MSRFFLTISILTLCPHFSVQAQTWVSINNGLTASSIQVLSADPKSGALYAGSISNGAFKRPSGGTWAVLSSQFAFETITALAINPANSEAILLGTEFGAHMSSDGGTSWRAVGAGGSVAFVRRFRFSPADPLRVLAATEGEGIDLSVDGGLLWSVISDDVLNDFTRDVVFHPVDSQRVLASAISIDEIPMRESFDGGLKWRTTGVGITSTITSLAIGQTGPDVVYAGTEAGVFVSEDDAESFQLRPFLDEPVEVRAIAVAPTNHLRIFAGTNRGVFSSADAGQTWSTLNDGLPTQDIRDLILDPANANHLYIGTGLDGAWSLTLIPEAVVDVDADFDGSGSVDFPDFLTFVAAFGLPSSEPGIDARADLDESGSIDFSDFLLFAAVFGN
jgi:hypothetical protein